MRRALKWLIVAVVIAEWYTRGGREFLFGDAFEREHAPDDLLGAWVDLPADADASMTEPLVMERDGEVVGVVKDLRVNEDGPFKRLQAYVQIDRTKFGYPINVALAQAADEAHKTLRSG